MVLHFQLPHLVDYYIIDPQWWFDICALVISPENVSKLIRSAGIMARGQSACVVMCALRFYGYSAQIQGFIAPRVNKAVVHVHCTCSCRNQHKAKGKQTFEAVSHFPSLNLRSPVNWTGTLPTRPQRQLSSLGSNGRQWMLSLLKTYLVDIMQHIFLVSNASGYQCASKAKHIMHRWYSIPHSSDQQVCTQWQSETLCKPCTVDLDWLYICPDWNYNTSKCQPCNWSDSFKMVRFWISP